MRWKCAIAKCERFEELKSAADFMARPAAAAKYTIGDASLFSPSKSTKNADSACENREASPIFGICCTDFTDILNSYPVKSLKSVALFIFETGVRK
jgi:hypothetical protein